MARSIDKNAQFYVRFLMDSFLRLHAIYLSASRWKIVVRVYTESRMIWRIMMWATKVAFIVLAVCGLYASSWHPYFIALAATTTIWALSFHKAHAEVFAEFYRLYPERIKYFAKDYQYIRYLAFKEHLESCSLMGSVRNALAFADSQVDAIPRSPIASHPFITFTLGALLAIVGGAVGQWPAKYVVTAISALAMTLYFSCRVLDIMRTPTSDLREFKRFLLWATNEQSET